MKASTVAPVSNCSPPLLLSMTQNVTISHGDGSVRYLLLSPAFCMSGWLALWGLALSWSTHSHYLSEICTFFSDMQTFFHPVGGINHTTFKKKVDVQRSFESFAHLYWFEDNGHGVNFQLMFILPKKKICAICTLGFSSRQVSQLYLKSFSSKSAGLTPLRVRNFIIMQCEDETLARSFWRQLMYDDAKRFHGRFVS